jgi:nickel/cobalt transporter (NicO) family protein
MKIRKFILTAFLVYSVFLAWPESPNPFTSSGSPSPAASTALATGVIAALAPFLRSLTDQLTELAKRLRDERTPGAVLAFALVSLAYGVFHSLGPGHGKTIVSSFFLAKDAKISHSLAAGYLIAMVHAISAIGIVLALFYLVQGVFSIGFENASKYVQIVSFAAIAAIGGVMLVRRILGKEHSHHLGHRHEHGHAEHDHGNKMRDDEISSVVTGRELAGIALASGIVPCPGASAILLVSLSLGVVAAGIAAVVMISVGMGITVTVIGAIAIFAKRGVIKASGSDSGRASRIVRRVVEIGGAALIFLLGLAFLLAQF